MNLEMILIEFNRQLGQAFKINYFSVEVLPCIYVTNFRSSTFKYCIYTLTGMWIIFRMSQILHIRKKGILA